jgi:hypothetical protein
MTIRRYYWTIAVVWYDPKSGYKREVETHYSAARSGSIRGNRRKLGLRCARYHQVMLFKKYGKLVPLRSLRVHFERGEAASKVDRGISVNARSMQYKGKHWSAKPLPSTRIPVRASKDESKVSKFLREIVEKREAKRKRIRAILKRLSKHASRKR